MAKRESGGKSVGKLIGAIAVGFLTGGLGVFGSTYIGNFLMGASLFSTVWSVATSRKQDTDGSASVSRFDRTQESMSSEEPIKIVYGMRRITGNQTWHQTDAEANILHKHVVLCEGGIFGVESLTANGLFIPTYAPTYSYNYFDKQILREDGSIGTITIVDKESDATGTPTANGKGTSNLKPILFYGYLGDRGVAYELKDIEKITEYYNGGGTYPDGTPYNPSASEYDYSYLFARECVFLPEGYHDAKNGVLKGYITRDEYNNLLNDSYYNSRTPHLVKIICCSAEEAEQNDYIEVSSTNYTGLAKGLRYRFAIDTYDYNHDYGSHNNEYPPSNIINQATHYVVWKVGEVNPDGETYGKIFYHYSANGEMIEADYEWDSENSSHVEHDYKWENYDYQNLIVKKEVFDKTAPSSLTTAAAAQVGIAFIVSNTKYTTAQCSIVQSGQIFIFTTPEKQIPIFTLTEANLEDSDSSDTYWDWQISVESFVAFINKMYSGWEAFPMATTSKYCGNLVCVPKDGKWYFYIPCTTGGSFFNFYNNKPSALYTLTGGYPKMAWLDAIFKVDDNFSGNPSVEALVKGECIFDTRYGSFVYSTNPAMCLRDLLLNKIYGSGEWMSEDFIDEDSFKEAANFCDEIITFEKHDGSIVKEKRYELNIIIDGSRSLWDWVQDILATFCGYIVISKGKFSLRIEQKSDTVYCFDDTNISEVTINQMSIDDCPNRYDINYVSPENNWKSTKVTVEDYSDQKDRKKVIVKEVNLEGCTSQSQALRLGRFYRDYNKICSLNISFKTGYQAAHLDPGDVVEVSYKTALKDMPIRITEIREDEKGEFTISGRQYNDSIYNDNLGAGLTAYNYSGSQIQMKGDIPSPSNVSTKQEYYLDREGNSHNSVTVTWNPPNCIGSKTYNVYRCEDGKNAIFVSNTPDCTFVIAEPIGIKVSYMIVTVIGENVSEGAYSDLITVEGKDEPPSPVNNLAIETKKNIAFVSWQPPLDPDIKRYKLYVNGVSCFTTTTDYSFTCINGVNVVEVYVEDFGGNLSSKKSVSVVMDLAPPSVTNLHAEVNSGYIYVKWDSSSNADEYEVSGSTYTVTQGTCISFPVSEAKEYVFYVIAKNEYGSSVSSYTSITVAEEDLDVDPEMITLDLLSGGSCESRCYIKDGVLFMTRS